MQHPHGKEQICPASYGPFAATPGLVADIDSPARTASILCGGWPRIDLRLTMNYQCSPKSYVTQLVREVARSLGIGCRCTHRPTPLVYYCEQKDLALCAKAESLRTACSRACPLPKLKNMAYTVLCVQGFDANTVVQGLAIVAQVHVPSTNTFRLIRAVAEGNWRKV